MRKSEETLAIANEERINHNLLRLAWKFSNESDKAFTLFQRVIIDHKAFFSKLDTFTTCGEDDVTEAVAQLARISHQDHGSGHRVRQIGLEFEVAAFRRFTDQVQVIEVLVHAFENVLPVCHFQVDIDAWILLAELAQLPGRQHVL